MRIARTVFLVILVAFAPASVFAQSSLKFPALTGRVVDVANILSAADERRIEGLLAAHEAKTTDQVVVVTVPGLQGADIETFGYQLGRHWGIGQKGKDNGVLLIVAPNERQVRIEVGYGLEGRLTDAEASRIIRTAIVPAFRSGDMTAGIVAGVHAILAVLSGESGTAAGDEKGKQPAGMWTEDAAHIFLIVFIFVVIVLVRSRGSSIRGGRRYPGWGPGSSVGGFRGSGGGFSGGGGGFGGGGSSGRW